MARFDRHPEFRLRASLKDLAAATLLVGGLACASSSAPGTDSGDIVTEPGIALMTAIPGTWSGDAYTILPVPRVSNDTLHLTVTYGGGCTRHRFALFAERGFMESWPVQSLVVIRHDAGGDLCRALLTRDLRFDLTRLRRAYVQSYGAQHATIILRIRGYPEAVRYDF